MALAVVIVSVEMRLSTLTNSLTELQANASFRLEAIVFAIFIVLASTKN